MKRNRKDKTLDFIIYLILTIFLAIILLPLLNVLARSLSQETAIMAKKVLLLPVDFTLNAYRYSLESPAFWRSFAIQGVIVVGTTIWAMFLTIIMAYPLTRKRLVGRNFWTVLIVFTMYFNPGLIPNYLVVRSFGMVNTLWAIIIPSLAGIYVLILKSYMETIDDALEESAKIDGASNIRILFSIIIPVCKPAIATLSLFYVVGAWTDYLAAAIYLSKPELRTLQLYLRNLLSELDSSSAVIGATTPSQLLLASSPQAVKAATVVIIALPMLILYPFIQRYFITGLTIGSVK